MYLIFFTAILLSSFFYIAHTAHSGFIIFIILFRCITASFPFG